ncbi:MAG: helix-turn-helix domain-containing protein [Candidatus Thorarchaeota archaeon]
MVIQSTIQVSSEDYYSCILTRRIPVRVSIVTIDGDTGLGILESTESEEKHLQQYVDELKESPSIVEVEVTYRSQDVYWTRVVHRMNRESIYETILRSGCMTRLPIVIEGGVQNHVVLSPSRERLRDLLAQLRASFTSVKIRRVQSTPTGMYHVSLTPKQREAFNLAFQSGYYEIPRKSTLEELSKDLGIKRVAMQERLRRAERHIMLEFAENMI